MLSSPLVLVGVLCLLWLVIGAVLYAVFVSWANHTDSFPRWAGARIALFEAQDPYAETSTHEIQRTIYGQRLKEEENQQGFIYPAHVIPLLFPFWLLPMRITSALWSSLSVLMTITLIWIYMLGRMSRHLFWVSAFTLMTAHILLVMFQGQFTLFVVACLGIAYWMYTHSIGVGLLGPGQPGIESQTVGSRHDLCHRLRSRPGLDSTDVAIQPGCLAFAHSVDCATPPRALVADHRHCELECLLVASISDSDGGGTVDCLGAYTDHPAGVIESTPKDC